AESRAGAGARQFRARARWRRRRARLTPRSAPIRAGVTRSCSTRTMRSSSARSPSAPRWDLRVIENGLKPDDRVVVAGILRAIPGQKAHPQLETVAPTPTPGAGSMFSAVLSDPAEFAKVIVKTGRAGEITRLSDVGRVELGAQTYGQVWSKAPSTTSRRACRGARRRVPRCASCSARSSALRWC